MKRKSSIKKSLTFKMAGLTTCVCLIIGLASAVVLYLYSSNAMSDRVNESAAAYTVAIKDAIDAIRLRADAATQNAQITDSALSLENRKAVMSGIAPKYGFTKIVVADANGKTTDGTDVGKEDYFNKAANGGVGMSSMISSGKNSPPALVIATKPQNSESVVLCYLSSETLNQMIAKVAVGTRGYGFVIDKSGKIIADKNAAHVNSLLNYIDASKQNPAYADAASLIQNMKAGKKGIQTINLDGSQQCVGYAPIPDTDGWSIGVSANVNEMMSSFTMALIFTALLTFLLIILSLLIAQKSAARIASPIIQLVGRLEKLAAGDLNSGIPEVSSRDEIGTLADSLRGTVFTLKSYVGEISEVLDRLADGDCTVETVQNYAGDFSPIKVSFNRILQKLNGVFSQIDRTAGQVSLGADQISGASQTLSQGSTDQAATIQELAASVSEIAEKVSRTASHARTAADYSQSSFSEVKNGKEHTEQMKTAMAEISRCSTEIEKINHTIRDIAFQTNILALNASVEAARAGSAGKGFSVVAEEVRNLAGKSAEAAKSTEELIGHTVAAVENGTRIADETGIVLESIIQGTEKTTNAVNSISESAEEQASAIHQITIGMDRISSVVHTNSAASEEFAATSQELDGQVRILKNALAFFKIQKGTRVPALIPAPEQPQESPQTEKTYALSAGRI